MPLIVAILSLCSLLLAIWGLARPATPPAWPYTWGVALILLSIAVLLPVVAALR